MSALVMHKSALVDSALRPRDYFAPWCGRSPRGALMTLHWKRVTCENCLRGRPNTERAPLKASASPP